MMLMVALLLLTVVLVALVPVVLAVGALWWWRSRGDRGPGWRRGDASAFLQAHRGDPRLPVRLRAVGDDRRVGRGAPRLLDGLAGYLDGPFAIVLDRIPGVGHLDDTTIGAVMLWLAWRGVPSVVWEEHFPSPVVRGRRPEGGGVGAMTGSLTQALRQDWQAGQWEALRRRLRRALPEWPIAATIVEVVQELCELRRNIDVAGTAGVSPAVTDRLGQEARDAAEALWRRADRIAATGTYRVDSPRMREDLKQEDEKLQELRQSIRAARMGLAELTLAGDEGADAFRRAERRFRALAETARELQELQRGTSS